MLSFRRDFRASDFLTLLQNHLFPLITHADSLLLAVSGGADSVALLDGCVRLLRPREEAQDFPAPRLAVAHLNHGLRGDEGQRDLEFVRSRTTALGLEFYSHDLTGVILNQPGESVEEAARRHRYDFLVQTATQHGFSCLLTAHHRDDQAETVLHNLIRGTGLSGLSGMPVQRNLSSTIRLLRPLLGVSRDVIRTYLAETGVSFVEDSTNEGSDFTRNRIRHQLIPLLERDFNAQIVEHLASMAEQVRDSVFCLDELAERFLARCVIQKQHHAVRVHRHEFEKEPSFLTRHALIRLWDQIGWHRQQMTARHWLELDAMLRAQEPGSIDLPGGIRAEADGRIGRFLCDSSHLTD